MKSRWHLPLAIYIVCAAIYVATSAGEFQSHRRSEHYGDHFVQLARSFLHGQLHVVGNVPPSTNDYANYKGQWFVTFPPFPALLLLPFVALFGENIPDRLFWNLFAALGPALLFVVLRFLSDRVRSNRTLRDNLLLTGLFAFGSVFYFTAVKGTTWFAAHVVATVCICLYVLFSLDARRPMAAGTALICAFLTRPTTALLGIFFVVEALRVACPAGSHTDLLQASSTTRRLGAWLSKIDWQHAVRKLLRFSVPVLVVAAIAMAFNYARFENPFEFGHAHLAIRWQSRIQRWGLFNYHYMPRNLAVFVASLPWLLPTAPYIRISVHGLALWFTTPNLLLLLWPKQLTLSMVALYVSAGAVAIVDLCYQNTGWLQFGQRFALDYLVVLFVLLALGQRRFGKLFYALAIFSVVVNTFGAITFERFWTFYHVDTNHQVLFQPD